MGETITLKPMEIDALGEVLNISLGSATTAVSNMLDARVTITAPKVSIKLGKEYNFEYLEPAISVTIDFVDGIVGKSLMVIKQSDARVMLEMLLGYEIPKEEFVLDELALSALSEVMNQMMGSSATVLSEMLEKLVNISTPITESIEDMEHFKSKHLPENEKVIAVSFDLTIGEKIQSEFIYLLSANLSKNLVTDFLQSYGMDVEDEVEEVQQVQDMQQVQEMQQVQAMQETEVVKTIETVNVQPKGQEPIGSTADHSALTDAMSQMMAVMEQQMKMQMQMQEMQIKAQEERSNRKINATNHIKPTLNNKDVVANYDANLDMIMRVPVEVSIEIGRTKKLIRDVLDLNKGSLVVLDKVAGESVDLYANGQLIARGDVVVVEDNFGVHVTEIISKNILGELE